MNNGISCKRDAPSSGSVISRAAALYPNERPAKRTAPIEKSTAKRIKTEDIREKKNPLDKYKNILVTAAGPHQTDYELSQLMTNIVESELNVLMNKIYESFPKEITNEAEKVVYNKYKGHVGAALRNTIGLNITKRLLNVHDRLLVKLTFASVPKGKELNQFIDTYKLNNFKKVVHLVNTYVAELKSYTDMDDLCSVKSLQCGNVEVTAMPCIPFMKCPKNLKTKFRSPYIHPEHNQTDTHSDNTLDTKVEQENTEITTKDDDKTKNSKAVESKESNQNTKSQEITKAHKPQESPKLTQKSQASENTKISSPKTPEAAKQTQTKPEAVTKTKTTPTKTEENANKPKTSAITPKATKVKTDIKTEKITPKKTEEESTKLKPITVKTEKITPTKTEETTKAKTIAIKTENTTPRKTESITTKIKTEDTKLKATPSKTITDNDKPKTSATKIEPTAAKTESTPKVKASTKSEEIPKPKTSGTPQTATKTDTTKAKTTPPKTETNPIKTGSIVSKTTPQDQKIKTQNVIIKAQTKTAEVKKPITTKSKEDPQSKPVNATKTVKTTITEKEPANKNKETKKIPERKKKESDFDELDDQDILAMLSGGIILDECSGSDDE